MTQIFVSRYFRIVPENKYDCAVHTARGNDATTQNKREARCGIALRLYSHTTARRLVQGKFISSLIIFI